MDVHPIKNVSIGIDPYPYEGEGINNMGNIFPRKPGMWITGKSGNLADLATLDMTCGLSPILGVLTF